MEIQWPLLIFSVLLGVTSGSFVFLAVGERPGAVSLCGGGIVLAAITIRSLLLIRSPQP